MSNTKPLHDALFEQWVRATATGHDAPARLKSRIYSRLMQEVTRNNRLQPLHASKAAGYDLCLWETLILNLPLGKQLGSLNHCRNCHARILGEHVEGAPLPWAHCPYAQFQKR